MNTNPDESTLALWLDDELAGKELAAVESWAAGRPDQLAAREDIRSWRATMASALPASEEPPYPEFFNSKVLQAIREEAPKSVAVRKKPLSWKNWLMPMAACAGMILAFWFGKRFQAEPEYDVANAPKAIPVEPAVYTPESGVKAEWFASTKASATVIVLNGVTAIPDTMDFSETVSLSTGREIDYTADIEVQPEFETGP